MNYNNRLGIPKNATQVEDNMVRQIKQMMKKFGGSITQLWKPFRKLARAICYLFECILILCKL